MVTTEIRNSLKYVIGHMKQAEHELNRPDEDVVTLSVCLDARNSMHSLIRIYLLCNGISNNEDMSLDALLDLCRKTDSSFSAIDMSHVVCRQLNTAACEGNYCLSHEQVRNCMNTANKLKSIVLHKLAIAESELN
jgi:hypothetical protein